MAERTVKLCSLEQAATHIEDGMRVAFAGFAIYQKPMAMVHAIIRAGIKDLVFVGACSSIEADMLVGAGALRRLETSYVGLEKFGMAPNYRRAVQNGEVEIVHYPEMLSWDRFRATREGLPYWPTYFLGGSDIVKYNKDIVEYTCPVTGKTVHAVPAADPDVVMVHVHAADKYGNVQMPERYLLPQYEGVEMARAAKKLIVTTETIIDTEELYKAPHRTMIPAFRTTCLVHVPGGSHPTLTLGVAKTDEAHLALYAEAARTPEGFRDYLDKYVYGPESFEAYLKLVGYRAKQEAEV